MQELQYEIPKSKDMKRYITTGKKLLFCLGTILIVFSCVDPDLESEIDERPILLMAGKAYDPTRAVVETTELQSTMFEEGEKINVWITGESDDVTTTTQIGDYPCVFTTKEAVDGKNLLDISPEKQPYYHVGRNSKAHIFAAYPANEEVNVNTLMTTFTVQSDQTTLSGYKNSDLMMVEPFEHNKTANIVNLPFKHKMVKLIVNAIADDGVTVDSEITIGGIKRSVDIDVENGDFTSPYHISDVTEGGYDLPTIQILNGGAVLFPPQEVTTSKFIMVTGTKGGQPQKAQFNIIEKTFQEGRVYKLNLHIGPDDFTPNGDEPHVSTITGWSEDYDELTVTPSGGYAGVQIGTIDGNVTQVDETVTSTEIEDGCYVYTGSPRCPKPTITYGTTNPVELIEGTDFRFAYVDNLNAGNAQVMVIGMGAYSGLAALQPYTIKRAKAKITFPENSDKTGENAVPFNPDENIGFVKAINTGDGDVLYSVIADGEDEDADCASVDPVDGFVTLQSVGLCTIQATATSGRNYDYPSPDDICKYKLKIDPKEVKVGNISVTYAPEEFIYDGTEKKLTKLVVADGEHTLAEGVDYESTFTNNIHHGKAKLTITGMGNYDESTKVEIEIPIHQAQPTITLPKTTELWLGKHSPTAPEDRRKKRVATTQSWAINRQTKEPKLYYSSEAPSVATVDPKTGMITGVGVGTTNIIVRVPADNEENPELGDFIAADPVSFPVTVVEADYKYELQRIKVAGYEDPQLVRDANGVPVGGHSVWICPADGLWQIDCYGAQGSNTPLHRHADGTGTVFNARGKGGRGAHIAGRIRLKKGMTLHVVVGEQGITNYGDEERRTDVLKTGESASDYKGLRVKRGKVELTNLAWNGGGGLVWGGRCTIYPRSYNTDGIVWMGERWPLNKVYHVVNGGGGATDVSLDWGEYVDVYANEPMGGIVNTSLRRLDWKSNAHLYSRIIVAGGGGGSIAYASSNGFGDGGDGGAWRGLNGAFNDYGEGAEMNRGGFGGNLFNWVLSPSVDNSSCLSGTTTGTYYYYYNYPNGPRGTTDDEKYKAEQGGTMFHSYVVYLDGPYAGGYSCTDGAFGEGGYVTQPEQGIGGGGGGWYGGGAGGEVNANGSGGGGSSFIWTDQVKVRKSNRVRRTDPNYEGSEVTMASLYDTIDEDFDSYTGVSGSTPSHKNKNAYKKYKPTTNEAVTAGNGIYCPYFESVPVHDSGANGGDGKAMITLISLPGD